MEPGLASLWELTSTKREAKVSGVSPANFGVWSYERFSPIVISRYIYPRTHTCLHARAHTDTHKEGKQMTPEAHA